MILSTYHPRQTAMKNVDINVSRPHRCRRRSVACHHTSAVLSDIGGCGESPTCLLPWLGLSWHRAGLGLAQQTVSARHHPSLDDSTADQCSSTQRHALLYPKVMLDFVLVYL
jgi:hypothetical protein